MIVESRRVCLNSYLNFDCVVKATPSKTVSDPAVTGDINRRVKAADADGGSGTEVPAPYRAIGLAS